MSTKSNEKQLNLINSLIEDIKYGSINVIIHDGQVTQIDATEKKRFNLLKGTNKVKNEL